MEHGYSPFECLYTENPLSSELDPWIRFPKITRFVSLIESTQVPPYHTIASLAWNERALFAKIRTTSPCIAAVTRPDEPVFHDTAIELFFDPMNNGRDYTELQINAEGRVALLRMDKPYFLGGSFTWLDPRPIRASIELRHPLNTPSSQPVQWSVLLQIPWDTLAVPPPKQNDIWRTNIAIVEWEYEFVGQVPRKRPNAEPTYIAWHPTGMNDLHRPDQWGSMIFR